MKEEKRNDLIERFPEMFEYLKDWQGQAGKARLYAPVGDGWVWLVENTLEAMYQHCKNNNVPMPQITDIKEKWGGLRIYYNGGDIITEGMVELAEHFSYKICEICGTHNNIGQTSGWIHTVCETCHPTQRHMKDKKWTKNK